MRAVALALFLAGCATSVFEARAVQPNPLDALRSPDAVPLSLRLYIHQRDLRLHRPRDYQLRSWAQFAVVARDRLRFHVGVVRYDESDADTREWEVWLEDDQGHRLAPRAREIGKIGRITLGWGLYAYQPVSNDGWCRYPPCLSRMESPDTVYEGQADYVFQEPDLISRERKLVSLVLKRDRVVLRYTWRFDDYTEVQHYGRTTVDDQMGIIAVPGPHTERAGATYDDE